MYNPNRSRTNSSNKDLLRYAGLGTQLLVAIGLALWAGIKLDKWIHTSPLFTVALPLLILIGIFIKIIKDTGKNRNNDSQQE